jgi:hypothetical protein
VLSQDESHELVEHLRAALREIEALPVVAEAPVAELAVPAPTGPGKISAKTKTQVGAAPRDA